MIGSLGHVAGQGDIGVLSLQYSVRSLKSSSGLFLMSEIRPQQPPALDYSCLLRCLRQCVNAVVATCYQIWQVFQLLLFPADGSVIGSTGSHGSRPRESAHICIMSLSGHSLGDSVKDLLSERKTMWLQALAVELTSLGVSRRATSSPRQRVANRHLACSSFVVLKFYSQQFTCTT